MKGRSQKTVEKLNGLHRRNRPIVNIPGNEQRVRLAEGYRLDDLPQYERLIVQQIVAPQRLAQMKVRDMEKAHGSRMGSFRAEVKDGGAYV